MKIISILLMQLTKYVNISQLSVHWLITIFIIPFPPQHHERGESGASYWSVSAVRRLLLATRSRAPP